jgi:hypothetical protein
MARSIISNKWESVTNQPNTECDSIVRPRISIGSRCKNELGARTRTQIDQWDQDSKETNDMPDEQEPFKLRQPLRKADIHDHTEQNDAPVDQRPVPCLVLVKIARIVERSQRLDYSGSKVCRRCRRELPPPERDPSEDPADNAEVLLWCQFGCPAILRSGRWGHGGIFGERGACTESSNEAKEEAIYQSNLEDPIGSELFLYMCLGEHDTYRAAIGKNSCEGDRVCLPWKVTLIRMANG